MINILWTIAVVLIAFWVLGIFIHLASMLIWPALVIAAVIVGYNLITGRRTI